jgi:hypothetical protein
VEDAESIRHQSFLLNSLPAKLLQRIEPELELVLLTQGDLVAATHAVVRTKRSWNESDTAKLLQEARNDATVRLNWLIPNKMLQKRRGSISSPGQGDEGQ